MERDRCLEIKKRCNMTVKTLKASGQESLNPAKPMFSISVVAEILKIHQRTLRIYDDAKLLTPSRTPKNRRLYSYNDIEKGKFIQFLTRELGINLMGIKIIFGLIEQQNILPENFQAHIQKIAVSMEITQEIQMENKEKLSKRGRKKQVVEVVEAV